MIMKDKIYKLNRPKGFYIVKRALIALTSIFICSIVVAVPLSILIYTQTTPTAEKENVKKPNNQNQTQSNVESEEENLNNELIALN